MKSSYMTDEQYERLLYLCARKIGTTKRFVRIKSIVGIGNGKYELDVLFRGYYLYHMVYDGNRITECSRVMQTVFTV